MLVCYVLVIYILVLYPVLSCYITLHCFNFVCLLMKLFTALIADCISNAQVMISVVIIMQVDGAMGDQSRKTAMLQKIRSCGSDDQKAAMIHKLASDITEAGTISVGCLHWQSTFRDEQVNN